MQEQAKAREQVQGLVQPGTELQVLAEVVTPVPFSGGGQESPLGLHRASALNLPPRYWLLVLSRH